MMNRVLWLAARTLCPIAVLMTVSIRTYADIYVESDKKCYICGEDILCSAFCDEANSIAYLELRDADKVLTNCRLLLENGRGGGSLTIPSTIPTGTYTLLCYTASGASDSYILTVFNTSSSARQSGVSVGKRPSEERVGERWFGERGSDEVTAVDGLAISREGSMVKVVNVSGEKISFCLSVVREDGLPEVKMKHISVAAGEALTGIGPQGETLTGVESDGEIIRAHLVGRDAGKVSLEDNVTAVISFPGVKTGIYTEKIAPDGSIVTRIEPVFGKRDIACLLYGESQGSECHLELDPKTYPGTVEKGPGMTIYPDYEKALLWRTNALIRSRFENADSVLTSLPVRREHFFLSGDATIFVLDDYKRFPTMEEEFVEILKCVRRRRSEENLQTERSKEIQVLVDDAQIHDIAPFWGNALVMMDGVPVFDQSRIWKYDPALVREVEIYRKTYTLGYRVYQGVVNFITYKGNAPAMDFNDNVRLYDFAGCSYPLEHRGESTLYWHPLLTLAPGETYSADLAALGQGPSDDIVLKIKAIGIVK